MSAIEHLHAMRDRKVVPPPLYETLGITVTSAGFGVVALAMSPSNRLGNPHGNVGGGALATALDTAAAWACDTLCAPGKICTTVEFKTNFIKAVRPDDPILNVSATVIHGGSRIMVAEAKMTNGQGVLVATATVTCLVIDRAGGPELAMTQQGEH